MIKATLTFDEVIENDFVSQIPFPSCLFSVLLFTLRSFTYDNSFWIAKSSCLSVILWRLLDVSDQYVIAYKQNRKSVFDMQSSGLL